MSEKERRLVSHRDHVYVRCAPDSGVSVELHVMANALLASIGEECVGLFPDFWKNGDSLEVTFRRIPIGASTSMPKPAEEPPPLRPRRRSR